MEILSTHEEIEDLMELYLLDYSSLESNALTMQARIISVEGLVRGIFLIHSRKQSIGESSARYFTK